MSEYRYTVIHRAGGVIATIKGEIQASSFTAAAGDALAVAMTFLPERHSREFELVHLEKSKWKTTVGTTLAA